MSNSKNYSQETERSPKTPYAIQFIGPHHIGISPVASDNHIVALTVVPRFCGCDVAGVAGPCIFLFPCHTALCPRVPSLLVTSSLQNCSQQEEELNLSHL